MEIEVLNGTNILDVEADAIVNSIGIRGGIDGAICEAILDACAEAYPSLGRDIVKNLKSKKYLDFWDSPISMDNKPNKKVKANRILHYITPRFDLDYNEDLLKTTFDKIIKEAYNAGYKSVAIPAIGTGYNSYSKESFWKAVDKYIKDVSRQKSAYYYGFEVIFVKYEKEKLVAPEFASLSDEQVSKNKSDIPFRDGKGEFRTLDVSTLVTAYAFKLSELYSRFQVDRAFFFKQPHEYPFEYLVDYCGGKESNVKKHLNYDKSNKDAIKPFTYLQYERLKTKKAFNLKEIVLIADALAPFNKEKFLQLLMINKISLSPSYKKIDDENNDTDNLNEKLIEYWSTHECSQHKGELAHFCGLK